ncbi:MAG: cyclopropane-fatty-acyl-phospholipid synthase family protein [Pseudomonadales bacterium]
MRISNVADGSYELPRISSMGESAARKACFQFLSRLSQGRLLVTEGGTTECFGEAAESAEIVAHIVVEKPAIFRAMMLGGTIGAAESYMEGDWHTPDLVAVVRLMVVNMDVMQSMEGSRSVLAGFALKVFGWLHRNTVDRARKNIVAHYDLGNDFYALFLDRSMMYSAAIFPSADSDINTAAKFKLQHICQRLQLKSDDHLLEIGTGWGGLAIHAAKHFGCRVTTTTISEAQYDYACERVAEEGLQDRITLLKQDYRELAGSYDKLVSVEMIEAVGYEYYRSYFTQCSALLKQDGLMLLQGITIADQRYEESKESVDFIKRYVFPGGCLPSVSSISSHVALDTNMQIIGQQDITLHYARTLNAWRERFFDRIDEVRAMGFDDSFIRLWEFYLCYCEGGFLERVIGTSQWLIAKPSFKNMPEIR